MTFDRSIVPISILSPTPKQHQPSLHSEVVERTGKVEAGVWTTKLMTRSTKCTEQDVAPTCLNDTFLQLHLEPRQVNLLVHSSYWNVINDRSIGGFPANAELFREMFGQS